MRTRNMRTEHDSKAEEECSNINIATNVRVSRRDAKLKETETRAREDSEKVSREKEKIAAPTQTRETRSRNRESRAAESISASEPKHPNSKYFNSNNLNNSKPAEKMIDECPDESGPSSKPMTESSKLPDSIEVSLPLGAAIDCRTATGANKKSSIISLNGETQKYQAKHSSTKEDCPNRKDEILPSKQFNLLIAATGSVATVKLIELIETLRSHFPMTISTPSGNPLTVSVDIKVVMTENAKHFTAPDKIVDKFNNTVRVHDDKEEWNTWNKMGDDILHIELRKWAHVFLIAPLDANTMGKLANGICDNLLTCTARAWDTSKPLIFCPAMNVHMYEHPLTREQITKLQSFGYSQIDCIAKKLACGDIGMGAMASVDTIVAKLIDTVKDICSQRDKPSHDNSVNLNSASLASQVVARNGTTVSQDKNKQINQITIQPVRPKIDLPQVDNFDSNLLRKRRRKSNPDGSDEFNDETASSAVNSKNIGYFAPQFSTINSLSVTIPSLRNNRTSLGLNHSISIKPKTSSSNSIIVHPPRNSSQVGSSILLSHDKIASSHDGRPTFVNQKRLINLSNSARIIRLNTDHVSTGSDQANGYDNDVTHDCNLNEGSLNESDDIINRDQTGSEEFNNSDLADFDPSNLLEQTMITDEAIIVGGDSNTNGSSKLNGGGLAMQEPKQELTSSPLIDTQKFLTMCYHQETNVFKCAICKNLYKTRKSMSRHLKEQHVQGPIFSCEACNVSYKRREKLIKHAREKHKYDNMFPQYTG